MNNVVIVSATRTAVGKFGGSLKDFSPGQLGSVVLKDALRMRHASHMPELDENFPVCLMNGLGHFLPTSNL